MASLKGPSTTFLEEWCSVLHCLNLPPLHIESLMIFFFFLIWKNAVCYFIPSIRPFTAAFPPSPPPPPILPNSISSDGSRHRHGNQMRNLRGRERGGRLVSHKRNIHRRNRTWGEGLLYHYDVGFPGKEIGLDKERRKGRCKNWQTATNCKTEEEEKEGITY